MDRLRLATLMAILILAFLPIEARASDPLAETVLRTQHSISEADAEGRRILGSLYAINKRMKKITLEKGHLTDELFSVQGSAKDTAHVIAGLEGQIVEQKASLRTRLRTLYKLSGQSYVAILFSQRSPAELDEALRGLRTIADRDHRLIRSYQLNVAAHRDQRLKLRQQVEKLVVLERKIRAQEEKLVAEHRAKTAVVSGLEASKAAQIERLQTLRAGADGVSLKSSFFESKGRLGAPLAGAVTRGFGAIVDERTKAQLSHKGWQISGARGAPISAVFDGSIAYSGWIAGYGNVIVVDHGDHYYSVYGNSAKPRFKSGDAIQRGQTIGEVGATAWRDGGGIYFEIRHFSDPEDPARWVGSADLIGLARPVE